MWLGLVGAINIIFRSYHQNKPFFFLYCIQKLVMLCFVYVVVLIQMSCRHLWLKKKKRRWMSRNKHLESLDQDWMVMIDIALLCSNKQLFSHLLLKDFSCSLMAFFTGFLWEWILRKIPKAWVLLCLASLVHLLWCNSRPHSFQKLLFYVKLSFQLSVYFFF